jgi:hypothetical protein
MDTEKEQSLDFQSQDQQVGKRRQPQSLLPVVHHSAVFARRLDSPCQSAPPDARHLLFGFRLAAFQVAAILEVGRQFRDHILFGIGRQSQARHALAHEFRPIRHG